MAYWMRDEARRKGQLIIYGDNAVTEGKSKKVNRNGLQVFSPDYIFSINFFSFFANVN